MFYNYIYERLVMKPMIMLGIMFIVSNQLLLGNNDEAEELIKSRGMAIKATLHAAFRFVNESTNPDYKDIQAYLHNNTLDIDQLNFENAKDEISIIHAKSSPTLRYIRKAFKLPSYQNLQLSTSQKNYLNPSREFNKTVEAVNFLLIHTYGYSEVDLADKNCLKPSK
jgi:hypothetical protein